MRKKFLVAVGASLVAAAVSAFVYVENESSPMDEFFNANVEALARTEDIGSRLCIQRGISGDIRYPECKNCKDGYYNPISFAYCD